MADPLVRVREDIDECGWHCLAVLPQEGEEFAPFAYTIGLGETHNHAELIIFGLPRETAHGVLAECVERVSSGSVLPLNEPVSGILSGDYSVILRPMLPEYHEEYLGTALRHYGDAPLSAFVVFWPDREGKFPWESELLSSQSEANAVVAPD